jgi:hypothetical protein
MIGDHVSQAFPMAALVVEVRIEPTDDAVEALEAVDYGALNQRVSAAVVDVLELGPEYCAVYVKIRRAVR